MERKMKSKTPWKKTGRRPPKRFQSFITDQLSSSSYCLHRTYRSTLLFYGRSPCSSPSLFSIIILLWLPPVVFILRTKPINNYNDNSEYIQYHLQHPSVKYCNVPQKNQLCLNTTCFGTSQTTNNYVPLSPISLAWHDTLPLWNT
jgi:hypothetical protein